MDDEIRLVGCSNGLICLGGRNGKYFYCYNPKTNQSHKYYPGDSDFWKSNWSKPITCWSFGYVSSIDDYKVVRIIPYWNGKVAMVHVFSLRSNIWLKLEIGLEEGDCIISQARLVNETLYWRMCGGRIVAFDLAQETFEFFPHLGINGRVSNELCVMGGCLSKCSSNSQKDLFFEIMKHPGRLVSVRFSCDLNLGDFEQLIGFTKTGNVFFTRSKPGTLGLLDRCSKRTLATFDDQFFHIEGYVPRQSSPHPLAELPIPLFSHPISPIKALFIQSGNALYLCSCDNLDDNIVEVARNTENYLFKLNNYDFDVKNDVVNLVGSCNGLVCLGEVYGRYFILWNPSTNKSHKYFSEVLDISSSDCPPHLRWGFGYVSSMDDYKVVRVFQYQIGLLVDTVVHLFSLRTNTWKKIEFDLVDYSYILIERPRLANETLYWTASHNPNRNMKIVAFDIACETFEMFPHLAMVSPMGDVLCVMGGCLSKCVFRSQNEWVIDIVRYPGRVYSVRLNCDLGRFDDLIGFTMSNKVVVAYTSPTMPGLVDLSIVGLSSRKSFVKFKCQGRTRIESYVTSQNSPHPPTEMPNL